MEFKLTTKAALENHSKSKKPEAIISMCGNCSRAISYLPLATATRTFSCQQVLKDNILVELSKNSQTACGFCFYLSFHHIGISFIGNKKFDTVLWRILLIMIAMLVQTIMIVHEHSIFN